MYCVKAKKLDTEWTNTILINMKYPFTKSKERESRLVDPRVCEIIRVAAKWIPVFEVIKIPRTKGGAGCLTLKALNAMRWVLWPVYFAITNKEWLSLNNSKCRKGSSVHSCYNDHGTTCVAGIWDIEFGLNSHSILGGQSFLQQGKYSFSARGPLCPWEYWWQHEWLQSMYVNMF